MSLANHDTGSDARIRASSATPTAARPFWATVYRSSVGRRFAVVTISCSSVLALLMTFVQLSLDYQSEKRAQDNALSKIETSLLPGLTESLWLLDETLIRTQLDGIARIEGVTRVEVTGVDPPYVIDVEGPLASNVIDLAITRVSGERSETLGNLAVHVHYAHIFQRIIQRAVVVLGTNLLKTICVALAILYIFERLVGRHIAKLSAFAKSYDPEASGQRLQFDAPKPMEGRETDGEFAALEAAINQWAVSTETHVDQLHQANREQAEFTYAISHDLKSPINTMAMLIRNLAEDDVTEDEIREILDDMTSTNARMGSLVVDVLDYSRLVEVEFKTGLVDVAQIIAGIEADLAVDFKAGHARMSVGFLPRVRANGPQLRILFQNLIANAIKFRKSDNVARVEVSATSDDDHVTFTVVDNGIGIPDKHREDVFGLFKRLHVRSAYDGTGLGLAICRRVVSNHGGEIWIGEGLEGGTAVHLKFPIL